MNKEQFPSDFTEQTDEIDEYDSNQLERSSTIQKEDIINTTRNSKSSKEQGSEGERSPPKSKSK